ncbi:DUF2971 domain-containing protein [Flavobacteriaceae bacterium KMM 6898]|nr:DUF2971 domain-containing protein [Flavobacteriaceae bacterium KMM 6898]
MEDEIGKVISMKKPAVVVKFGKLDDFDLPKTIYKYRDWSDHYHKRFILEREVFLASPKTFEDELDCHNPTRFDLLTKDQIYDYFIWSSKKENPLFSRQRHRAFARDWAKHSLVNDKNYTKKFMEDSVTEYYEREGILSLTENWDNDAMWKKYAAENKGFCIGYDTRIIFKYLGGGGPVSYTNEIPIIMPEPFMKFEEAMRNRVYYKLKKWEFEDEYRTKKFWPHPASINERQIQLPIEAFKRVILGDEISLKHKLEIERAVKKNIGNIEIVERKNAS